MYERAQFYEIFLWQSADHSGAQCKLVPPEYTVVVELLMIPMGLYFRKRITRLSLFTLFLSFRNLPRTVDKTNKNHRPKIKSLLQGTYFKSYSSLDFCFGTDGSHLHLSLYPFT